jgi:hypothetical protein
MHQLSTPDEEYYLHARIQENDCQQDVFYKPWVGRRNIVFWQNCVEISKSMRLFKPVGKSFSEIL